jgi:predicted small lipoprotein YifL
MRQLLASALAALMLALGACGTKGPLYLPPPGIDADDPRYARGQFIFFP